MTVHGKFDDGALDILGVLSKQKTIKTHCGKRVSFVGFDAREINCPECLARMKEQQEFKEWCRAELTRLNY